MSLHHAREMFDPNTTIERMQEIIEEERREQRRFWNFCIVAAIIGVILGVVIS